MIDLLSGLDWRAPWWGLLALQPLLLRLWTLRRRQRLEAYADAHLLPWAVAPRPSISPGPALAYGLAWLLLAAAAAGPRLPLLTNADGRLVPGHQSSLYVLLDLSESMAETDIAPTRQIRARLELDDWLARLSGERVGLIVYAGSAGVLLPPTDDSAVFRRALGLAEPGLIEARGTRLDAALELAGSELQAATTRSRAILLLSDCAADGLSGAAGDAVRAAARKLARQAIPIFVFGVGSAPSGLTGAGNAAPRSPMDVATCQDLARLTGGRFALVANRGAAALDALVGTRGDPPRREQARAWRELYPWLLAPALVLLAGVRRRGDA